LGFFGTPQKSYWYGLYKRGEVLIPPTKMLRMH
jgi:hypothetical protein